MKSRGFKPEDMRARLSDKFGAGEFEFVSASNGSIRANDVLSRIAISAVLGKLWVIYVMRKVVLVALVAWAATTNWAQATKEAKPETVLRWSFIGTQQLAEKRELKVFRTVRELPEAAAWRDAAAANLAERAARRYTKGANTNAVAQIAEVIKPLIADLIAVESRFQMDTAGGEGADWMLALKVDEKRHADWGKSMMDLTRHSGMQGAASDKTSWVATRDKYKISFSRAKDWTVIEGGLGAADSKASKEFRASLNKRAGKNVLDALINTPLLGKIWDAPQLAHYPKFTLSSEPKDDGLHSELMLEYPSDLGIKPEKWNVPDKIINEPVIGFTAIQGVQKKLESLERFKALGAEKTPNQIFFWSQGISPFSVALAAEVKNPAQVVTNASRVVERMELPAGDAHLATNRPAFLWTGLPVIVPFIQPAAEPHSSFVTLGLFPVVGMSDKPAPRELLQELNKKNLVYYDWEITSSRLRQFIPIWQIYYVVGQQFRPQNTSPSGKFLQVLKENLGNTITVGTLEKENQIKFVRQSHIGFSALELVLMSHLFDSADLVEIPPSRAERPKAPVPAPAP
jgi:hypothetical protein